MKTFTVFLLLLSIATVGSWSSPGADGPKVLLIVRDYPENAELALTGEVGVMVTMLKEAGFRVVVSSQTGAPISGGSTSLKPDLILDKVRSEDYAGVLLPCMSVGFSDVPPRAVEIVQEAVAAGKPVAAQNSAIIILGKAGVLKGKKFALQAGFGNIISGGIYAGTGVVGDSNIFTSGTCPFLAAETGKPDGTRKLTQAFIDALRAWLSANG